MSGAVSDHRLSSPAASYADRALGCLFGGAVGDALGYGVEFDKLTRIRERFGPDGIQEPVLNRHGEAEVSDDTQMTLFTLAGLLAGIAPDAEFDQANTLEAVRLATLDWYGMQTDRSGAGKSDHVLSKYAVLGKSQAPGGTCLSACMRGATGTPENRINNSKGCGGVMRVAGERPARRSGPWKAGSTRWNGTLRRRARIERHNATPELLTAGEYVEAVQSAGFEVIEAVDQQAEYGHPATPWYMALQGRDLSLSSLARIPAGRALTAGVTGVLERLRMAPAGTSEAARFLNVAADALVEAGELGIFTPSFLVHARKPA